MANEQLKQALRTAGLEADDLADKVGVDVKTAERWLAGRTPHPRHRRRVADALDTPERVLWPKELPDHDSAADGGMGEIIEELTAGVGGVDWRELLASAAERAWLLDLTLSDIITDRDAALLAAAAARGCRVRVLVSHRDSVHLTIAEQETGREVSLTNRPASTAELDRVVQTLTPHAEIELRTFVGAGAYRVLIFDDQALVTLRLPGVPSDAMPLLYLARQTTDGIFDSFTQHFEALWQTSQAVR